MGKNRDFSKFPNAITVLDNGNVGIGVTNPTGTLEISKANSGGVGPYLFLRNNTSTAANNAVQISFAANSGGNASAPTAAIRITEASNAASDMSFYTYDATTFSEKVRISSIGYVGIGTNNPQTFLQVVGTGPGGLGTINIKGVSAHLGYQDTAGTFKGWIGYYNAAVHGTDTNLNIKTGYKEASNIVLNANGDTGEAMRINGSGNVAIGNSSPLASLGRTLTVEGTGIFQFSSTGGNYNENLRLNRAGNGYSSIAMGGSYNSVSGTATGQWTLVAAPSSLNYKFYLEYAGTETFTVRTTGQMLQNGVGLVQIVPIGPTATNLSYSGSINGQYTVGSTSIPSSAQWLLADIFMTANISDHQNFMITRFNFGTQKTWVDTRGNNPANEFGNLTQGDVVLLTYYGESDGFTSNYGIWKTSVLVPSSGRNIWINNYGNSGSSGYLYFIVRGYSL